MLLVGYFEDISSQRGIAWRCSDSLSLRKFLGVPLTDETPDHSSLTRIAKRLPAKVNEKVFEFVLKIAVEKKLLKGNTVAVDSTSLEANAAMRSIVRKTPRILRLRRFSLNTTCILNPVGIGLDLDRRIPGR